MSFYKVFDVAGSALSAQQVRMNTTASNIANAGSVSSTEQGAYRAKQPIFETVQPSFGDTVSRVRLAGITESNAPIDVRYEPGNPNADADGNVYISNVNAVEEMVNLMSASRSYQNNIEVITTTRDLLSQTLQMGR